MTLALEEPKTRYTISLKTDAQLCWFAEVDTWAAGGDHAITEYTETTESCEAALRAAEMKIKQQRQPRGRPVANK